MHANSRRSSLEGMISNKTLVEAAVSQYHSDDKFREFVDCIRAKLLTRYNSFMSVEDFLAYEVRPGLPAAVVIYSRLGERDST